MAQNKGLTYRAAGVDITAGNQAVELIKEQVKTTWRPEVLTGIGSFGGMFALPAGKYREPVLVSGTDGVGTKLRVAMGLDRHHTIGIDAVAMCVNDIIVHGAEPLFFLDYLAVGYLQPERVAEIVAGVAEGCRQAGCALIGGETAEMPGFYAENEYDIAGFAVGVVERSEMLSGASIQVGDQLIGLPSSGLHSNGYSLARKVLLEVAGYKYTDWVPELGKTLGDELLTPTRIYARLILDLCARFTLHGIAHITGGGLIENLPRILPAGFRAHLFPAAWPVPAVMRLIQERGPVVEAEMYRTFNMGLGMVLAIPKKVASDLIADLLAKGETAYLVGEIRAGEPGVEWDGC